VCSFLGINNRTYHKYLRTFENGGQAALFARQTKSNQKFDNGAVKQAVFGLLHEPPSNYGINRTTWIMHGMARSIIHNSDYKTLDEAKAAIDRYFADRNAHFLQHAEDGFNHVEELSA
jgi:hypothetical protein